MTTTSSIRSFALRSIFFAGAVALAVTTSGCIVDTGPGAGYGGSCQPDLFVDWQIQNSTGAPVTCAGAGAATVVVSIAQAGHPKVDYPQTCVANQSTGSYDAILPGTGSYDVTVALFDSVGTAVAPSQTITLAITNSCTSYETPSPALLVVSPPAP